MGLFNKLKNALFEEEEIELPVKETKEEKNVAPIIKEEIKKPAPIIEKKEEVFLDKENERDLFKSENTFKFPDFDEEEFSSSYKPPAPEPPKKEPVITPKESFERVKPITYEFEKKPRPSRKESPKRETIGEDKPKVKTFKPSPVISPVYGVLDKNYKKEDIITVKEEPKKKIDVDTIRRKAFGTLEDDIEMSFDKPKEEFYRKNTKSVDDLLKDTADETIDIMETQKSRNERNKNSYRNNPDDEEMASSRLERRSSKLDEYEEEKFKEQIAKLDDEKDTLQVIDEPVKDEEQRFEEDTLENDLFDLIDSMYDNREEDEN